MSLGATSSVQNVPSARSCEPPDGVPFTHKIAEELSHESHLVLVCGHYKGIDDRIRQTEVDMEISIGDFVVSGGELPAMLLTDAVVRLIDGALGNRESGDTDSFAQGVLGWPVYTRPEEFEGKKVPEVLLSGHHKNISGFQMRPTSFTMSWIRSVISVLPNCAYALKGKSLSAINFLNFGLF